MSKRQRIDFVKYHGAGNDFILIDDRRNALQDRFGQDSIAALCHRRFGIGADGLMFLRSHPDYDFEMVYYNSDGAPSSMCGNGGRCIVRFAADLGLIQDRCEFLAVDGPHEASLLEGDWVSLKMNDVDHISSPRYGDYLLDTGSPHYIRSVVEPFSVDVVSKGRALRNSAPYREAGINVNFVRVEGSDLQIATYERGVEDETLACGTGITAAAIAAAEQQGLEAGTEFSYAVQAKGGRLRVRARAAEGRYTEIYLEGPAVRVFTGAFDYPFRVSTQAV